MVIGSLHEGEADRTSYFTPKEINSLAIEVLEKGGDVIYFPNTDLVFVKNNIAFKFRY